MTPRRQNLSAAPVPGAAPAAPAATPERRTPVRRGGPGPEPRVRAELEFGAPTGRQIIAQRFNAGWPVAAKSKSRQGRQKASLAALSLSSLSGLYPSARLVPSVETLGCSLSPSRAEHGRPNPGLGHKQFAIEAHAKPCRSRRKEAWFSVFPKPPYVGSYRPSMANCLWPSPRIRLNPTKSD